MSDQRTTRGYLLLADLSGYTAFLTGAELGHATAIVGELSRFIREQLDPPMRFVKAEGDAVLCHAEWDEEYDGERLLELIETCYFGFANRLADMERETTCPCRACATMGSLDLKFVAHYGPYTVQADGDREDLAGPEVILAHRLLKNSVVDKGGPRAYALLTDACRLPEELELPTHREANESFGEVSAGVHNLGPVLARMRQERRVYVSAEEADIEVVGELQYPPAVVWPYYVAPEKRMRWQGRIQTGIENERNEDGRLGAGASSHCAHGMAGDVLREYLDWRPYAYFTNRFTPLSRRVIGFAGVETMEFIPTGTGTRVEYRFRFDGDGWGPRLRFWLVKPWMRRMLDRRPPALRKVLEHDLG